MMFPLAGKSAVLPRSAELSQPRGGQLIEKDNGLAVGPRKELLLQQGFALTRRRFGKLPRFFVGKKISDGSSTVIRTLSSGESDATDQH
jgi:hypothetical protein